MISKIQFAIKGKVKCDKTFRVSGKVFDKFVLLSGFVNFIKEDNLRVLKQRKLLNLIKQFKKKRKFFLFDQNYKNRI